MILVVLRIIFTSLFVYFIYEGVGDGDWMETGDVRGAYYMAKTLIMAIFTGIVWAPYVGEHIAEPITGKLIDGNFIDQRDRTVAILKWLEARRFRRLTVFLSFMEGINRPWLPSAFMIGLHNSLPGSLIERIFAKEVYRFNNAHNCLLAYQVLLRHGIMPPVHEQPEINIFIGNLNRETAPERTPRELPPAGDPPKLERNANIQLFEGVEHGAIPEAPETQINRRPVGQGEQMKQE